MGMLRAKTFLCSARRANNSSEIFSALVKSASGGSITPARFFNFFPATRATAAPPSGCPPWGNPTRNVFGWQRPCYLLVDEGYAPTFKALIEETDWNRYGTGNNPKCTNCMAHCGYEATAVNDTITHPLKAFKVFLQGPR